jgi:hypothetical protein
MPVEEIVETKPEDLKAFVDARNKGQVIEKPTEKTPPAAAAAAAVEEPKKDSSRSMRREMNRLREELGAARARAELLESQGKPAEVAKPAADAEPKRADFPSGEVGSAEFLRASQKWDRAQEAKAAIVQQTDAQKLAAQEEHWKELDAKTTEDIKLFPDWEAVMGLLIESYFRAHVAYYFAKHTDKLQAMLDLSPKVDRAKFSTEAAYEAEVGRLSGPQIKAFHNLEGRLEMEYAKSQPAAQAASVTEKEDRKHPAEAEKPGGTAAAGQAAKPKPSSEVAARGGSPAPDEPAIGSPAWMLKRNQGQYEH